MRNLPHPRLVDALQLARVTYTRHRVLPAQDAIVLEVDDRPFTDDVVTVIRPPDPSFVVPRAPSAPPPANVVPARRVAPPTIAEPPRDWTRSHPRLFAIAVSFLVVWIAVMLGLILAR